MCVRQYFSLEIAHYKYNNGGTVAQIYFQQRKEISCTVKNCVKPSLVIEHLTEDHKNNKIVIKVSEVHDEENYYNLYKIKPVLDSSVQHSVTSRFKCTGQARPV